MAARLRVHVTNASVDFEGEQRPEATTRNRAASSKRCAELNITFTAGGVSRMDDSELLYD